MRKLDEGDKEHIERMLTIMKECWRTVPELSLGEVIEYVLQGDRPSDVPDKMLEQYMNDFILNNM